MLVVELKGLGLGQDLNPNNNVICHVIFSQKKENTTGGGAEQDDNVSTSVKARQFILQKVIVPFVKELRQGDPNYDNISANDAICDGMQHALCLDSDMTF